MSKKYVTIYNHLIRPCLKEELDDYKSEIESLEGEKLNLRDTTAEDFFNNLKKKEKGSMINLEGDLNFANDLETNFSEINPESERDQILKVLMKESIGHLNELKAFLKKK